MSTEEVTAYVTRCDITGCDEVTEPQISIGDADEVAIEAGWFLDEDPGHDMCPTHTKEGRRRA